MFSYPCLAVYLSFTPRLSNLPFSLSCSIKLNKYGDRMLEIIEATIKQHYKIDKNSSSSNESADSIKRRREAAAKVSNGISNDNEDDLTESTGRSKKRAVQAKNIAEVKPLDIDVFSECLDDVDLDFDDSVYETLTNGSNPRGETNANGRKLPSWSGQSNM